MKPPRYYSAKAADARNWARCYLMLCLIFATGAITCGYFNGGITTLAFTVLALATLLAAASESYASRFNQTLALMEGEHQPKEGEPQP